VRVRETCKKEKEKIGGKVGGKETLCATGISNKKKFLRKKRESVSS
jgi:hypothetical protein